MIRKAAVAISLVLLAASFRLNALGLGEIDMISALNQPMNATIGLTSAAGVDLSQVKIGLASRAAHEKLGLTRQKVLGDFRFVLTEDRRGEPVINISSTEPVREPYLEFLLEMEWESGRMVREYTVLIDPPVTMVAEPVAPLAPVAKAPVYQPPVAEPVARAAPAPRPPATTFATTSSSKPASNRYGAVRRDEALWSIAKRLRPDNRISIQQMMLALLKVNPQAFPDNNINNLKAGSTLTIPDRELIMQLSAEQARAEAGRQYNEWLENRGGGRAAQVQTAEPDEPVYQPPIVETVSVAESEAQLKLTPPEGMPAGASATSTAEGATASDPAVEESLRQQLTLAAEEVEASRAESQELRSRVLELEEQIKKMQRLLELKSDALAGLQGQAGEGMTTAIDADTGMSADAELSDAAGEEDIAAEEDAGADTASVAQVEDPVDSAAGIAGLADTARGFVDKLISNPVPSGIGVLIAMLLGGFIWGGMRKHKDTELDEEPTIVAEQVAATAEVAVEETSSEDAFEDAETAGQDDAEYGIDESSADDANDPLTEADVYLAYGRVHQAEDVLKAALQDDPDNLSLRAKLLEVYHSAGNVAAFNSAAADYIELKPEDDPQWNKIATLGYELSPGNELYSASSDSPAAVNNSVDFDMDLSGMDEIPGVEDAAAETSDLDMDADVTVAEAVEPVLEMETESSESVDLDEHIEFKLDESDEEIPADEGLLASTDEVATKLDLARAYLDMEDPDGARSILQEVIAEGSAEQKTEAESLIEKIG